MNNKDFNEKLALLLKLETTPPEFYPRDRGIWLYKGLFDEKAMWSPVNDLPEFAVGDIEVKRIGRTKGWDVELGVFLDENGSWYIWTHDKGNNYEVSPDVLIGHNALEHDSKFLDTHYQPLIIDTMLLVRELFGIPPERQKEYRKLKQNHAKGLNVPEWFHYVCESSLKASAKHLLGEDLKITKKDGLAWYCANDVYATLRIAQRLIPLALSNGIEIYHQVNKE